MDSCDCACLAVAGAVGEELSDTTLLWYRRALLHNLRFDESVAAFSNASGAGTADEAFLPGQMRNAAGGGACTAISFRTGVAASLFIHPLLYSGVEPLLLPSGKELQRVLKVEISLGYQDVHLFMHEVNISTLIFYQFQKPLPPLRVLPLVSCSVPTVSVHAKIYFTSSSLPALCRGHRHSAHRSRWGHGRGHGRQLQVG